MEYITKLLESMGFHGAATVYLADAILIAGIALLCIFANYVTKGIVLKLVTAYIRNHSRTTWNHYILEHKIIQRLSHLVPAIIIYYFSFSFPLYTYLIAKGVFVYMIIVMMFVLDALLNAINDIYITYEISKTRPIRGYIQVVKIFLFTIGGILVISNLIGQSPLILLSGIGALSAVLLLIFKDSLLGLVAGVQLTANDMVRVGDWIEMTKYGADGDVIDISLNTVKVQNWDKTITTIPTYALISDSFKNWRGMQNSGGRRIKRAVYIDVSSIAFCTPEMIEKFRKIHFLNEYIARKEAEIDQYNQENGIDRSVRVNGRAMTNIGVFRAYIQSYIEHHPNIHEGMTRMIRQLAPEETGIPLEVYAFTNDINWAVYEGIQSDIFDHILAVAPDFGLRIFQNPTGHDLKSMVQDESEKMLLRG
ncbi:mechanosensitive ion channel family protein [Paenibacillus doosanensis]|uniref:mechanosensitive ion channel family protein n=1 Tax=Paenibacillus doosanensis TaxID=1229154 RepID=UPI00217F29B2|nr:mechanosensitive ion channel family protein [Paenibacillus doosanensis]MCS7462555.1 mechanosensitive ion channel family protein [Paenibacillus doosanensis]